MVIIASREANQVSFSNWTEYLVLSNGATKKYQLFTGQYESLAEADDFYNQKTEDYDLPEKIDGKEVHGLEREYVVGGDLQWFEDSQIVEFDDTDDPAVSAWLIESEWSDLGVLANIEKAIAQGL